VGEGGDPPARNRLGPSPPPPSPVESRLGSPEPVGGKEGGREGASAEQSPSRPDSETMHSDSETMKSFEPEMGPREMRRAPRPKRPSHRDASESCRAVVPPPGNLPPSSSESLWRSLRVVPENSESCGPCCEVVEPSSESARRAIRVRGGSGPSETGEVDGESVGGGAAAEGAGGQARGAVAAGHHASAR
jgi:hypothetical protein